jgi:hypothetical protein
MKLGEKDTSSSQQLTKREHTAIQLAGHWLYVYGRNAPTSIGYINDLAIKQADDLLRKLEETQ